LPAVEKASLAIGLAGLAAGAAGGSASPGNFFPGYLFSFVFWVGLTLGCMAVLMVHYQVGGSWGFVTRRILEAGMLTLPLMAALFVPILFGLSTLFPWARPSAADDPLLRHQQPYTNVPFFLIRAALYFASWTACALLLARWSSLLDRKPDPRLPARLRRLSGAGLVLYGFSIFFASIDWVLSTEPRWSSTIYGLIFVTSQSLGGFVLATAVLVLLSVDRPLSAVATGPRLNDLGNLILTTVMLWAYVSFSQYLIIWSENLPREIVWYVHRSSPGWKRVALALIALHFGVPFVLLLFRAIKRKGAAIAAVAWGLFVLRMVDDFWRVIPAFRPGGPMVRWTDVPLFLGIGGLWVALFVRVLRKRPLLPLHDPAFAPVVAEVEAHA
jgi:hypothetical protein